MIVPEASPQGHTPLSRPALLAGMRRALSLPGLILAFATFGFGAFARDLGFSLWQVGVLSAGVWALPSAVVFASATAAGASLAATALAVALSAVRLMPMAVAIVPLMRQERARPIWFGVGVHFVAVTGYVEAMLAFPSVPPERRLSFFLGLGTTLMIVATSAGLVGYVAASRMPAPVALALTLITPIYFTLSILRAAGTPTDRAALFFGLAFGPIAHLVDPAFDLLWAGLAGGTLAAGVGALVRRRG